MLTAFVGFSSFGVDFWIWVHGEEAVMFVNPHAGKQSLCIAKEMYITSICKFSYYSSITRNLEWAQICMLCVCLFIKLCWNEKPGTTLNSTAMSSQLTFCVALCHKIML
jgi:hypothetical protein